MLSAPKWMESKLRGSVLNNVRALKTKNRLLLLTCEMVMASVKGCSVPWEAEGDAGSGKRRRRKRQRGCCPNDEVSHTLRD